MLYQIKLAIGYDYGAPSDNARTHVRLLPPDIAGQQIVSMRQLTVSPPPDERRESTDFFGNTMSSLVFHTPIQQIDLELRARVERLLRPPSLDFSRRLDKLGAEMAAVRGLGPDAPHHFLGASPRVDPDPAISQFALDHCRSDLTVMQNVEAIGHALHSEMQFDADATDVDTPPAEAFANRHGVCQDFSHIMIAALRSLNIPAGYVSGFLRTMPPPGQPRLEGADAMHAWVSAWCGLEAGWIEFDPTNACRVALDHITVAFGRDYADVSPVKGALRTTGEQRSYQRVDVEPLTGG